MPLASAVVLNFKSYRDSIRCVEALQKQTIANDLEILLIDNHSDDESMQYLYNRFRDTPGVKLIETNANLGYGQGNVYAVDRAEGEFIMVINPDNRLEENGLERMIDAMKKDPTIGLIAPRLVYPDGSVRDSARRFPTVLDILRKRTFLGRWSHMPETYISGSTDPVEVDWIAGACFVMRKDFFQQLHGFDPRFFLFFEDADLCRRIWAAGKRVVYWPAITAKDRRERLSQGGVLSLLNKKTARIHLASGIKYFHKWGLAAVKGR